jgi:SAM-dependent methyltransferase
LREDIRLRYSVNRACPITGAWASRTLGHIPAGLVVRANETYRPDALERLAIAADDEFPIVEGPSGLIFAGWLPGEGFLRTLYDEVIDHAKARPASDDLWYRRFLWSMAEGLLAQRAPAGRPLKLLDYGCGYGQLSQFVGGREIAAVGYEPSAPMHGVSDAFEVLGDRAEVAARGPFDLLVCIEVLEHLADPRAALRFLREQAASDALLLVTVPLCPRPYALAALDGFSRGAPQSPVFNPWEHLNYFSAAILRTLLRDEGFAPIADLGRSHGARLALSQLHQAPVQTALRIGKRLLAAEASTQLVCRLM